MKLSLIISLDSSERLAIYSFERLPIDIYNLRIEYHIEYDNIAIVEEKEDNDIVILRIEH